jgi:3-mercaptopyruvate sulfurtransferase SseA
VPIRVHRHQLPRGTRIRKVPASAGAAGQGARCLSYSSVARHFDSINDKVQRAGRDQGAPPPAQLKELFEVPGVRKEQEAMAYCELGIRAASVYFALRLLGYPHVRLYDGSWMDWSSVTTLPVEK